MSQGFDWIAPYYDSLARLVFGKTIRRSQLVYLDKIASTANVLILGGGTGWILDELFRVNPTCRVWYVEASKNMLDKARARAQGLSVSQVSFIHGTERNLNQITSIRFDAVIANFYFDVFTTTSLGSVLKDITNVINTNSKLLVSEFVEITRRHRLLLFAMYRFFRWTCSIEATELPDWEGELRRNGFTVRDSKAFYDGFIKSSLYVFHPDLPGFSERP